MFEYTSGHLRRLGLLYEYEDRLARLFPSLPRQWSISTIDAFALGAFIECYPRKMVVLDIGTFAGMSAFYFAVHSKVSRVVSVDPNPLVVDEIGGKLELVGPSVDLEALKNLRVMDLAQRTLAEFDEERRKIELHVGIVGNHRKRAPSGSRDSLEQVEMPGPELPDELPLLAFVDGLHTPEVVRADLEGVFERHPHAVAFLHDCRGYWGPQVRAGVASFLEVSHRKYRFRLIEAFAPTLDAPNLGIVYPVTDSAPIEVCLSRLKDPLQVLRLATAFVVLTVPRRAKRHINESLRKLQAAIVGYSAR